MKHENALETAVAPVIVQLLPEDRFFQKMADLRELIARRAYALFTESGFTHGHDLEHWLHAESQLLTITPLEVSESQEAITVRAALPGYSAKDIEIHVEPLRFFISGQHREESENKKGKTIQSEQRFHRTFRSMDLPARIDPERVRATFSDGKLQIVLPKVADAMKAAA
jgi:HSP20 family molecular chaperone IbpA